jgi:hypothetical protein
VLSYKTGLDLGLNTDTGAVTDPERLCRCITEAAAEVLSVTRRRAARR